LPIAREEQRIPPRKESRPLADRRHVLPIVPPAAAPVFD
jgi:hypothetical protein